MQTVNQSDSKQMSIFIMYPPETSNMLISECFHIKTLTGPT